jgi:thiol:disulfide interchange protein
MESFKQGMSFLLLGTAMYMMWILGGIVEERTLLKIGFGMVVVGFACWVYGRWCLPHRSTMAQRSGLLVALLAVMASFWLGWPPEKSKITWDKWSPDLVKALVEEGETVYVDFTARWCSTCLVNKEIYDKPEVVELFEKHKVHTLKADWSDRNDLIAKVLFDFKVVAIPFNVIYAPKQEPIVVNDGELLSTQMIEDALAKLPQS